MQETVSQGFFQVVVEGRRETTRDVSIAATRMEEEARSHGRWTSLGAGKEEEERLSSPSRNSVLLTPRF